MANKNVFKSNSSVSVDLRAVADTRNRAGGVAYSLSDEEALAALACTGTFNGTFYSTGESTLNEVVSRLTKVRPEFIAKLAVYAARDGFMKDSPALLLASLMVLDNELFKKAFPRVVYNGKMLRNFCQIVRSGAVGRKSFGSSAKRLIQNWLNSRTDEQLFEDSVGNDPSLADVIKMVHPKPSNDSRAALYAYLIGKEYNAENLPAIVKEFEAFKKAAPDSRAVPNVSFQLLTAQNLTNNEWKSIAQNAKFHMTRMNLSTFARHGVFADEALVGTITERLSSEKNVRAAKVFPYQLYTSYLHADPTIPASVRGALETAMEHATRNIPKLVGNVLIGIDFSGSMGAPVTGSRGSATTVVSCNQVASLIAACVARNSDSCDVYRFDTNATKISLKKEDSVMTNARLLTANGGGTDCASVLRAANASKNMSNTVIIVSDTESWSNPYGGGKTNLMHEWAIFKKRNPQAKMVLIDLAASTTTQARTSNDILNVSGFSDAVFEVITAFLEGQKEAWVKKIEAVEL